MTIDRTVEWCIQKLREHDAMGGWGDGTARRWKRRMARVKKAGRLKEVADARTRWKATAARIVHPDHLRKKSPATPSSPPPPRRNIRGVPTETEASDAAG